MVRNIAKYYPTKNDDNEMNISHIQGESFTPLSGWMPPLESKLTCSKVVPYLTQKSFYEFNSIPMKHPVDSTHLNIRMY